MDKHQSVQELMANTLGKMRELVDSNTVIGTPITNEAGVTIIPVSKISFGFVSGGTDFATEKQKDLFGGGGGAGITVTPKAFLVIENGTVRMLQLARDGESIDRLCNMIPDAVSQISNLLKKDKSSEE